METVFIRPNQKYREYPVNIGSDLSAQLARFVRAGFSSHRIALLCDTNTTVHASRLADKLVSAGLNPELLAFDLGEKNKTKATADAVTEELTVRGFGKDSVFVICAGGVGGDLFGYVGDDYNRGVPIIQYATTLVSAVDSSIGGKVGVDFVMKDGTIIKNHVGGNKDPEAVFVDIDALGTLPDREFRSGIPEIIKYGITLDKDLFEYLEKNIENILKRSPEHLMYVIKRSCYLKGYVVSNDPHEEGQRKILNLGHTWGHAIESLSLQRKGEELLHGEALAPGIMGALDFSHLKTGFSLDEKVRVEQLFTRAGHSTKVPGYMPANKIIELTKKDKKAQEGSAEYTLVNRLGEMERFDGRYTAPIDGDLVAKVIEANR